MADKGFNGTSITLCGVTIDDAELLDVDYTKNGQKIKVSGAGAIKKLFEVGIPEEGCTVTIVGANPGPDYGDKGDTTVNWNDGTSTALGNTVCDSIHISGAEDDKIQSVVTVCPTPAAS